MSTPTRPRRLPSPDPIGLAFLGSYLAFVLACLAAWALDGDPKGAAIWRELPVMPQAALVFALGGAGLLAKLGWAAWWLLLAASAALMYACGLCVDQVFGRSRSASR